jgi:hypothetical protein
VLYWFASDPRTLIQERLKRRRHADAAAGAPRGLQDLLADARGVVAVPSFLIIASQGVVGAIQPGACVLLMSPQMMCEAKSVCSPQGGLHSPRTLRCLVLQGVYQGTRWHF